MYKLIGTGRHRDFRALWMLEELDASYEIIYAEPRSATALAHSPTGKIPVLLAEDMAIADSMAILVYLADKYQKFTAPAGSLARAQQDAMTYRMLDELEGPIWSAMKHKFALPKEHRVKEVIPSLRWEFSQNLRRIGDHLQGPFFMGQNFTIADILFMHLLNWAKSVDFFDEMALFDAYRATIKSRAAYQKVIEIIKVQQ